MAFPLRSRRASFVLLTMAAAFTVSHTSFAQEKPEEKPAAAPSAAAAPHNAPSPITPDSTTEGSVTVGGQAIAYRAIAGTITVGGTDPQDATIGFDGKPLPDSGVHLPERAEDAPPTARMFYAAYFKKDAPAAQRPITFIYNGGPGSPTMWLHMGTFGPKRIVTPDTQHQEGAPYSIVNNEYSLLDVSDLVFIDAPGTGLSPHLRQKQIRSLLRRRRRRPRLRALHPPLPLQVRSLELAQVPLRRKLRHPTLRRPRRRPSQRRPQRHHPPLSDPLPSTTASTAPPPTPASIRPTPSRFPPSPPPPGTTTNSPTNPPPSNPSSKKCRSTPSPTTWPHSSRALISPTPSVRPVAEKLHTYTGLPVDYLLRADLRVTGGEFSKELKLDEGTTTGRLDSRYQGPDVDPLSQSSGYDPQSDAVTSAWNTAINQYLHDDLKYATQATYLMSARQGGEFSWNMNHQPPGRGFPGGGGGNNSSETGANVMPDLAYRMKMNPKMKVMLAGGYYDLATPYFEGIYEMHHLPMPRNLQANISYHYYEAGHMIYVNEAVLKQFKADVANFIKSTESGK